MSTSRDIHESLNKLKVLGGLNDITPNLHIEKLQNMRTTMNRKLIEYKNALQDFKLTNQERAELHYTKLSAQDKAIVTYDQILEKLRGICALPQMLDLYIATPTSEQAQKIYKHCRSILYMHERPEYDPLFKTHRYFDPQGFQHEPEYGKWTYKGKTYEMDNMITEIQRIMQIYSKPTA
jgi:hypothetical protein